MVCFGKDLIFKTSLAFYLGKSKNVFLTKKVDLKATPPELFFLLYDYRLTNIDIDFF